MMKRTPAQEQYNRLKQQQPDALLFFRLGDFYELFYDDAKIAHEVLSITLTARNKNAPNPIPMAGIPYHSLDKYTPLLLQAGHKVAIAEQIGEARPGVLVDREIVRVLTPGTIISDAVGANVLMSIVYTDAFYLAWGDVSLGTYSVARTDDREECLHYIAAHEPRECVLHMDMPGASQRKETLEQSGYTVSLYDGVRDAATYVKKTLGVQHLDIYGAVVIAGADHALALLWSYVVGVQYQPLTPVHKISTHRQDRSMLFDTLTRDNLEIFSSRYGGLQEHTLYAVINTTRTSMGARLLYDRLAQPSAYLPHIQERLTYVARYMSEGGLIQVLNSFLRACPDVPRLLTRCLRQQQAGLLQSLLSFFDLVHNDRKKVYDELMHMGCTQEVREAVEHLREQLGACIVRSAGDEVTSCICVGYDEDIDKYRQLVDHGDELFVAYQQTLQEHTNTSLKLKRIKNKGYLLEVTPKDIERFEASTDATKEEYDFVRIQSLKGGQRYITPYLRQLEQDILAAKDALRARELVLIDSCVTLLREYASSVLLFAEHIAQMDLAVSAADLALTRQWCVPQVKESGTYTILGARHPVVEEFLPHEQSFIPNDLVTAQGVCMHLITGPNMGGKSTYLRQQALILLLAHAGMPVPATSAEIPLTDGLFARIGAGDALAKHQSTFMTEMLETAYILQHATQRSCIILDELGRGTATYDGLALAQAIVVHICQEIRGLTLFATHYHELTNLADELPQITNYHVSVYEQGQDIVFLKKILSGKASKSYGIDVAKLAGIPHTVLEQARKILATLENEKKNTVPIQSGFAFDAIDDTYKRCYETFAEILTDVDIENMTPLESLLVLKKLQEKYNEYDTE